MSDKSYDDGVRDGRLKSLEKAVADVATDMRQMKAMVFALYGAIALVQFLPELLNLLRGIG